MAMAVTWPLTGRIEELRLVADAMRPTGGPQGVVLAGASGVGKTRLAREVLADAARRGARTWWVAATASARGMPFGAFHALLGAVGGDPTQVLRQASEALLAGAGRAGVVLGVDDAHLLDNLSASLVHRLVLRCEATVVATVRSGEPAPDAVVALWKDGHLDRLEVQPLTREESDRLLVTVLDGPVESAATERMWTLTRGNALYLWQLVNGELEAGRLREIEGLWRWSGEPVVSPGLVELMRARMGKLTLPVREVVDVLAVAEPIGVALLVQLTGPAAVEEAEERGLVSVEPDGRRLTARLAHPLYGEVRRTELGRLRARRLRGRICLVLGSTGGRRAEDTLRRAMLAVDSDLDPDPELFTTAARDAIQLIDLDLAQRLVRVALDCGGGLEARLILASVLSWMSRGEEADLELAELAASAADHPARARAAVIRAANLFWTLGRPVDAESLLDSTHATMGSEYAGQELTAARAAFHGGLGRPADAIETAQAALGDPSLPDQAVVLASWGLVMGLGAVGRADEVGLAAARGYLATTRSFDAAVLRFGLSDSHLDALRLAGYVVEAEQVALARRDDSSTGPGGLPVFVIALLGRAALAQGRLGTAVRLLRETRVGLAGADTVGWRFRYLLSLTFALAMSGDAVAAHEMLAEAQAYRHPAFGLLETELVLAEAWAAAAQGTVSQAIAVAHRAAEVAAGRGQFAHEMVALHTAVCFGDRTLAVRLAGLAERVQGPRAPVAAAHAAALAEADADALHGVSVHLERLGDLLAAADAAAHAATTYLRQARLGSATAALARARRLAEDCEGARTPALIAAARPLPVTEREREIITLAAQGLSNRDIAARLVVSVRTIEGHLYRASAKLGATNRGELGRLLHGD